MQNDIYGQMPKHKDNSVIMQYGKILLCMVLFCFFTLVVSTVKNNMNSKKDKQTSVNSDDYESGTYVKLNNHAW